MTVDNHTTGADADHQQNNWFFGVHKAHGLDGGDQIAWPNDYAADSFWPTDFATLTLASDVAQNFMLHTILPRVVVDSDTVTVIASSSTTQETGAAPPIDAHVEHYDSDDFSGGGHDSEMPSTLSASDMPVTDFANQNTIVRLEQIMDFQDAGNNQDIIDFSAIRTFNGAHLYLDDHDGRSFELGEIMTLTNGDGHSFISADISGDSVVDLAVSFDHIMTTLDNTDFLL